MTPDEASVEQTSDSRTLPATVDRIAERRSIEGGAETDSGIVQPRPLRALADSEVIEATDQSAEASFAETVPKTDTLARSWRHLTILEPLGEGRFGTVYRAFDNALQINVALKLSPLLTPEAVDASAVVNAARLLAKVRHPRVVQIHGVDHVEGRAGIWMELVRGQTLDGMVQVMPFTEREAIAIGTQLSQALAAVHNETVLHGDINAHNVIRRDNADVVLVDFGAGRTFASTRPYGGDAGTLVDMAPEVLRGEVRSPASDVYSLGVLLFYMVTGRYPVWADSIEAARDAHERGRATRLRELRSDLSHAFITTVERATSDDPSTRYSSAHALETGLRAARPVPRWKTVAVAAGLLAIIGLGFWATSTSDVEPAGVRQRTSENPPKPTGR
jgi:serine/threonine protein kinase